MKKEGDTFEKRYSCNRMNFRYYAHKVIHKTAYPSGVS